jgi:hypothetical protein
MTNNSEDRCANCGEFNRRHVGRSEMCPYDRKDISTIGKDGWPIKPTYFKKMDKEEAR